jgi:fructokinase
LSEKIKITGTGFLTLDIILNGSRNTPPKLHAGGSFGNVLTILSYLGFETYPIARLADNIVTDLLIKDIEFWNVNTSLIFKDEKGSTPIIIHRILKDKLGKPKHKFEFRNPINGNWLPSYRPFLSKKIKIIENQIPNSNVYYFDRVSRSSIDLATQAKENGAIVYFEPSSYNTSKQFVECIEVADIIKYSSDRIKNYKELFPKSNAVLEIETDGSKGIKYRFKSDLWKELNSYLIENTVDTAGAGDWCSSGIIKIISKNGILINQTNTQIEEALNYGQALGAINCLFDGARGVMYNLKHKELEYLVEKLLNENFDNNVTFNFDKPDNNYTYLDVEDIFNSL